MSVADRAVAIQILAKTAFEDLGQFPELGARATEVILQVADAVKKLAPRALWWFRWGAMFTFLTGATILLLRGHPTNAWTFDITLGALLGTLMFLNVWLIIWPAQKIVCGIVQGDAAAAGPKAMLASRTNTLFSAPMLMFMASSTHFSHGMLGAASTAAPPARHESRRVAIASLRDP